MRKVKCALPIHVVIASPRHELMLKGILRGRGNLLIQKRMID